MVKVVGVIVFMLCDVVVILRENAHMDTHQCWVVRTTRMHARGDLMIDGNDKWVNRIFFAAKTDIIQKWIECVNKWEINILYPADMGMGMDLDFFQFWI